MVLPFTGPTARGAETVTKKDIVRSISEKLGLTQHKTKQIVQRLFDAILKALVKEGRVELRGFGVFEVKRRAARRARNPRTGESVDVPERFVVTFKPGQNMQQRADTLGRRNAGKKAMSRVVRGKVPKTRSRADSWALRRTMARETEG